MTAMNRRTFVLSLSAWSMLGSRTRGFDITVKGPDHPELTPFDDMMTSFLEKHSIPGAALAVSKDGKLVYAKGFGYADPDKKAPVRPRSLFRIASISKPFTAVAILQLVEQEKITLDDKVFDILNLEERIPEGAQLDPRWKDITIQQLLRHTGGWDRDKSFDPMFRQVDFARQFDAIPPASPEQIIRAMLGVPLDFDPGERYAYSNFGYCMLGRVIETITNQPYEQALRSSVLAPLGINGMKIGRTRLSDRARHEVRYVTPPRGRAKSIFPEDFGQSVLSPYGAFSLETLDSHGGWIASAVDLVRFASALDADASPSILKQSTIETMFTRPEGLAGNNPDGTPKDSFYALGWMVRPTGEGRANTWHSGSLDGTSTILVRRHDGLAWAVLFNTRNTPTRVEPAGAIDPLVHQAADQVKDWPAIDLFPRLLREPNDS
jgi:N-acyl-D-amino-acid deacylase